jgi:ATP-dependent RNA helicase DeaD
MQSDDLPAAADSAVHPALRGALARQGYDTLTAVQLAVLAEETLDVDLLVSAQTGSGKTVAFGLAIAPTLLGEAERFNTAAKPLGLVIAPTRELALQVQRELDWLYAQAGVVTASCVGGMDQRTERRALERGAHIVVGTPGRLRDHISRHALDLSEVRAVVLDEADEMLDLGFREDLEFILAAAPEERRTLLFSATVPRAIAELAQTFQRDALRVTATDSREQHADIEYRVTLVQPEEREHAIINTLLLNDDSSALIFCHTREAVRHLTARLANRGFAVVALSGELAQSERTSALQAMRDGRARVCVATDVAARGIDLPNLDLVIHADIPGNPDTLLHRSGRTGRAGRKGVCVLIVPAHRRSAAARVLRLANLDATPQAAPSIADIEARYREQILIAATASPPPDEAEAPVVAELLEKLTPEQIATAYLRQQLAARPVPEEISHTPIQALHEKGARRESRFEGGERPPFEPRTQMSNGVWFSLSLGRKQRADPKWLLPMICKAGGVTKRDVGSIKILDAETRFEISGERATEFAQKIARDGTGERGVRIGPAGPLENSGYSKPKYERPERSDKPHRADSAPARKPRYEPAPAEFAADAPPRKKRYEPMPADTAERPAKPWAKRDGDAAGDGAKPFVKPKGKGKPGAAAGKPGGKDAGKPRVNPKDKGKPKYKGKAGKPPRA